VAVVREKDAILAASLREGPLRRWLRLADLWCARWAWPAGEPPPPPTAWAPIVQRVLHDRQELPPPLLARWLDTSAAVAARCRFVHWPLHFPEVFFEASGQARIDGGFDAVIGNPPWDVVRDDVREAALREETASATARLAAFVRGAGIYGRSGGGHLNRCQLFVERALGLLRTGGRLGLVLPWGVAADRAAAPVRRRLFEECDTDRLVAFENAEAIFPVHRGVRFVLWTATTGRSTAETRCRIGERSLAALDRPAGADAVSITPAFLRRVSGGSLEVPWVRTGRDAALLGRLSARWPPLSSPAGWQATFGRELNATDDRAWFSPEPGGPPVVDGRHVQPFRVDVGTGRWVRRDRTAALLERLPAVARPRLAYRDVASAGNRVTLIAAMLPAGVVSTHTLFCLRPPLAAARQRVLCALLNSYVANYLARLRVTTHVSTYVVEQLPVPVPDTEAAARLGAAAAALEREPASDRAAVLQADCARLFGLNRDELAYVLGTFPLVEDAARSAVLDAFDDG
jgi:hypothetical protein